MSISYRIVEVPDLNGQNNGKKYAAKVNSAGTVKLDELCQLITARSAISSADVKAVLDSFCFGFKHYLENGYSLNLNELGFFSPSLTTRQVGEEDGAPLLEVKVRGINYRPTVDLKDRLALCKLSRSEKKKTKEYSEDERLERVLNYVEKNRFIDRRQCQKLNSCSAYRANSDLKALIGAGKLVAVGYGRSLVYVAF